MLRNFVMRNFWSLNFWYVVLLELVFQKISLNVKISLQKKTYGAFKIANFSKNCQIRYFECSVLFYWNDIFHSKCFKFQDLTFLQRIDLMNVDFGVPFQRYGAFKKHWKKFGDSKVKNIRILSKFFAFECEYNKLVQK